MTKTILRKAIEVVTRRSKCYGPPIEDFKRTAGMLNALGFRINGQPLQACHIGMIMMCAKLSRAVQSPVVMDHWVDMAGYANCAYEAMAQQDADG